ncbi:hypothetical protein V6Z12_D08G297500 [Gossypium hirsutum]
MFRFKERMNFSEKGNRISDAKQYAPGKMVNMCTVIGRNYGIPTVMVIT